MGMVRRFSSMIFLVGGILAAGLGRAEAQTNLLSNGNFETGTFAGWTVANVRDPTDTNNSRNFFIDAPGTNTPFAGGIEFKTEPNELSGGGGNFYAITVSDFPGETALIHSFTTPTVGSGAGLRVTFTFDAFVNDQSGYSNTLSDGGSLDYTTGGLSQPRSNQFARVDLLRASSADFSTSASDVLLNVPLNVPINPLPSQRANPYQRYSVDLSPYVQANTTYKIRFAEVDNLSALHLGVDNVGIRAEITPEPSTLALTLPFVGIAPVFFAARLRRAKTRKVQS